MMIEAATQLCYPALFYAPFDHIAGYHMGHMIPSYMIWHIILRNYFLVHVDMTKKNN